MILTQRNHGAHFPSARLVLGLLLTLLLTGCGFHLRGQLVLPENLQQVQVNCTVANSRQLCLNIRNLLQDADIQIVPSNVTDTTVAKLHIDEITDQRRAVSIGSDAGVAEYEVTRSVRFRFNDEQGNPVIADGKTTQFQTYRFDELSILGKDKEEEQIREELDQLLAQDILGRVAASAANY